MSDSVADADVVDIAFIAEAVRTAKANALRMALYQVTGDEELLAIKVTRQPGWGGVAMLEEPDEQGAEIVRRKAMTYLTDPNRRKAPPPPADDETRRLMSHYSPVERPEDMIRFGMEELAFAEHPRGVRWTLRPKDAEIEKYPVLIIGAGICGIALAVQCESLGIPYKIIERMPSVGGTWFINNYPDARVDIDSFLYQFKFMKNYAWPERFAARNVSMEYLSTVVAKFGISKNVVFNTEVVSARWDEDASQWLVEARSVDGLTRTLAAKFVVSAAGIFNQPKYPDIEGIASFEGEVVHTARWPDGADYKGRRVAVIGGGATGAQLLPKMAESAGRLDAYLRTPQWIYPVENYKGSTSAHLRWLMRAMPYYWNWYCYAVFIAVADVPELTERDADWQRTGGLISRRNDELRAQFQAYLRDKVRGDEDLIRKLTPAYPPLARRPIADNGFYDALLRDNVGLITERIERITRNGIVTVDGVERVYDMIVLATGFEVEKYLWPTEYIGRKGKTVQQQWGQDGARAHLGVTMPGFPNFFMMYGPNSQPRNGGLYTWAELWSRYIAKAIVAVIERGASEIEVRDEVYDNYNSELDLALKKIIRGEEALGGYMVNQYGRHVTGIPWRSERYHAMLTEESLDDFIIR